jgi:serine/threonine-protein kinase RsbW
MTQADRTGPLTDGYSPLLTVSFRATNVTAVRHGVRDAAARCGMSAGRADEFMVAVHEVMTNVVRHGGGTGRLRLWCDGVILCQVVDRGPGFDAAPHLNRTQRPSPSSSGGMGLWVARQTSDGLAIDSGPAGTTVSIRGYLGS